MVHLLRSMVLVSLSITVLSQAITDYSCSHTDDLDIPNHVRIKPRKDTDNLDGHSSHTRRDAATNFTETFTVTVSYDSSFTTGLSSYVRNRLQNKVIPQLLQFFESTLKVRPLPGPLLFDRDCTDRLMMNFPNEDDRHCNQTCEATTICGTAEIPSDHLKRCRQCNGNNFLSGCQDIGSDGPGVDSAFSLYISAKTAGSCSPFSSTLAFAGMCQMEDVYDRPVAGYINFCPATIDDSRTDDYLLTVAKHEMLHTLGFSRFLFGWWRDENGDPRSPRDADGVPTETSTNTVREVTYNDWSTFNGNVSHTVSLLVTPKIVEEGRRHFNCSTLEGVQLEDQGGSGTASSHWEARITRGEGMNGVLRAMDDVAFSRLTFALLEDSGWYEVDYSLAEQFIWGRGSGCEFTDGSCGGYIASQQQHGKSISPFCDTTSGDGPFLCNLHRTGVSYCNRLVYPAPIPAQYRYFEDSRLGGSLRVADYCPYQQAFTDTVCTDTANAKTGIDNIRAQSFRPNSRCVEHGQLEWTAEQGGHVSRNNPLINAGCYEYTCSDGNVIIHILDESYSCTVAGQEFNISQISTDGVTYNGSIICPSCLEICYDDFDNCPEAAQKYSEFVSNVISTTSTISTQSTFSSQANSTKVTVTSTNSMTTLSSNTASANETGDSNSGFTQAASFVLTLIFIFISIQFLRN